MPHRTAGTGEEDGLVPGWRRHHRKLYAVGGAEVPETPLLALLAR